MTPVRFSRRLALAALLMATAATAAAGVGNPLVEHGRSANNRFKDVKADMNPTVSCDHAREMQM